MPQTGMAMCANKINFCTTISYKPKIALGKRIIDNTISSYLRKKNRTKENIFFDSCFKYKKYLILPIKYIKHYKSIEYMKSTILSINMIGNEKQKTWQKNTIFKSKMLKGLCLC